MGQFRCRDRADGGEQPDQLFPPGSLVDVDDLSIGRWSGVVLSANGGLFVVKCTATMTSARQYGASYFCHRSALTLIPF